MLQGLASFGLNQFKTAPRVLKSPQLTKRGSWKSQVICGMTGPKMAKTLMEPEVKIL